MNVIRTNLRIPKNDHIGIVPAIQNGYMAAPAIEFEIDYSVFKKSTAEKGYVKEIKSAHRAQLQAAYGPDWKNHLNIPSKTIKFL